LPVGNARWATEKQKNSAGWHYGKSELAQSCLGPPRRKVRDLHKEERRRRGQKSLTNIVRVLRRSWGHWLRAGGSRGRC
jgi:hypothetical protein